MQHIETQDDPSSTDRAPSDAKQHEAEDGGETNAEQSLLPPPPVPPVLQNTADLTTGQDELMKHNFPSSAQAEALINGMTEEDIASILDDAKMTTKQASSKVRDQKKPHN